MPVCLGDGIRCHILVVAIAILVAIDAAAKVRFIVIGIVVKVLVIATIVPRHFGRDIDICIMPLHLNGDRIQCYLLVVTMRFPPRPAAKMGRHFVDGDVVVYGNSSSPSSLSSWTSRFNRDSASASRMRDSRAPFVEVAVVTAMSSLR